MGTHREQGHLAEFKYDTSPAYCWDLQYQSTLHDDTVKKQDGKI